MRTWLVVLGIVIAVLGASLVLSLFVLSGGGSTTTRVSPSVPSLASQSSQSWDILGTQSGPATVTLSWTATAPADVSLVPATPCNSTSGYCPVGNYSLNWTAAERGKGTLTSVRAPGYLLMVHNPGGTTVSFSAAVSVTYGPASNVPTWTWGVIASGGIVLLVIGGIALFLGLFLAPGVYRPPGGTPDPVRHPSLPPDDPEADDRGP